MERLLSAAMSSQMSGYRRMSTLLKQKIADRWQFTTGYARDIPKENNGVPLLFFSSGSRGAGNGDMFILWLLLPVIIASFGALHCAAWNFPFRTEVEQNLWRSSALVMVTAPFATCYMDLISHKFAVSFGFSHFVREATIAHGIIWLVIHMISRCYIMVESLVSLRALPPSSFTVIAWTSFLPHL